MSVQVAIRCRPLQGQRIHSIQGKDIILAKNDEQIAFSFDTVLDENSTQEETYSAVGRPMIDHVKEGYNCCLFCYGQSGSGKSYSMIGSESEPGILFRFCKDLISGNREIQFSFCEIYQEKVRDLLLDKGKNLRVREHTETGPYVENLTVIRISTQEEMRKVVDKAVQLRSTAATLLNDQSSRSHALFILHVIEKVKDPWLETVIERKSKVTLVDLAGSERNRFSGTQGERLKEGSMINKSLTTLGLVITALTKRQNQPGIFVPYRDSMLTWLLKDSLGGNSKTVMLATIRMEDDFTEETTSTLRYAARAKKIKNKPTANEDPKLAQIRELKKEIEKLKTTQLNLDPCKPFLFDSNSQRLISLDFREYFFDGTPETRLNIDDNSNVCLTVKEPDLVYVNNELVSSATLFHGDTICIENKTFHFYSLTKDTEEIPMSTDSNDSLFERIQFLESQLAKKNESTSSDQVHISIPNVFLAKEEQKSYHIYTIHVQLGNESWIVYRRYSEFREFYSQVSSILPKFIKKCFPGRVLFALSESVVEKRRFMLSLFLTLAIEYLQKIGFNWTCMEAFVNIWPFFNPECQ